MRSRPEVFGATRAYVRAVVGDERGLRARLLTAGLRRAPDFLIIGAQKGGTTSLYSYLCEHPSVVAAERIEVHYFDLAYDRPWWWYKSHFPGRIGNGRTLTGEASPYYLFHPLVPERVR
jgi:lipopolysaccharide transport system ATP-binding protein